MKAGAGVVLRIGFVLALTGAAAPAFASAREERADAARLIEEAHQALSWRDGTRARGLMEQAAAAGDPEALNGLATFVEMGVGAPPDPEFALRLLEQAASQGSLAAKLNIGLRLGNSERAEDHRRAVELLTDVHNNPPAPEAREQARAIAAGGLGVAFLLGRGVMQDVARGVDYLEEADAAGDADERSLFLLARAYQRGWDVRQPDPARAFSYFERAAEQGHAESAWQLSVAYLRGAGVPADDAKAYQWARRSADAGNTRGVVTTAYLSSLGRGVAEDDREARRWYELAVEKGSPHALRGLGEMLMRGQGGARDEARGLAYVMLAERAGLREVAADPEARLPASSTRTEARARRIAENWLRTHTLASASD